MVINSAIKQLPSEIQDAFGRVPPAKPAPKRPDPPKKSEAPLPPPREKNPPKKLQPPDWLKVRPHVPWYFYAHWFNRLLANAEKATSYMLWLSSPRLTEKEQIPLNVICTEKCDFALKMEGHVFCQPCGCGTRPEADVRNKNSREGHNCPLGLLPGSRMTAIGKKRAIKLYSAMHKAPKGPHEQVAAATCNTCGRKKG